MVPPPPEFAASSPNAQSMSANQARQALSAQQKVYVQRKLQASTSPLTVSTGTSQTIPGMHHHQTQYQVSSSSEQTSSNHLHNKLPFEQEVISTTLYFL